MSTVNRVHNIRGLNISLCQMVETGGREDQRPVDLAARHTEMVCNSGLSVKWVREGIWVLTFGLKTQRATARAVTPCFCWLRGLDMLSTTRRRKRTGST